MLATIKPITASFAYKKIPTTPMKTQEGVKYFV